MRNCTAIVLSTVGQ